MDTTTAMEKFKPYTRNSIQDAPQWQRIPADIQEAVMLVSRVLPFRTNAYVMNQLIDWDNIPDDPIFRLTFPHQDMLLPEEYSALRDLVLHEHNEEAINEKIHALRLRMNPHPA